MHHGFLISKRYLYAYQSIILINIIGFEIIIFCDIIALIVVIGIMDFHHNITLDDAGTVPIEYQRSLGRQRRYSLTDREAL